ncbi:MAG: choice-of-anchor B family protein [Planctomycetota bacterium]
MQSQARMQAIAASAIGVLITTTAVFGHADDPKNKNREKRVEAPAYRASDVLATMGSTFDSNGVTLMSWLPISEFGPYSSANDCWGYVSPSGREYAIIGFSDATSFVEVTDPGNPQIIATLAGPNSLWRDIKTYQSYAYAVSEGGDGIQVFDMSDIDNGNVVWLGNDLDGPGTSATHNVAIDEVSGYLYRLGGTGEGMRIYSLTDPTNPQYVASWPDRYIHDAQIVTMNTGELGQQQPRQIAFCASGFNGGFVETGLDILDVTDKNNIIQRARYTYPTSPAYSHQCWLSEDRQTLYLNDELNEQDFGINSTTHVIDVSDLDNPFEVRATSNGNPAVTHNLYVNNGKLFAANYRSGLRVFDVTTDQEDPVEVGYFDTYPANDNASFNGLWSSYPFFPSGIVIGSDLERGLFVWFAGDPELTFEFPSGVPTMIDPSGTTKFDVRIVQQGGGSLQPGTAQLNYNDGSGYVSVPLTPMGGDMYEASIGVLECPGSLEFFISAESQLGLVWRGPAEGASAPFTALVATGFNGLFADDFEIDRGWSATNLGASSGDWQRGVPVNDAGWDFDPVSDADGSGSAYLTQNENGNTDVDDGAVELLSPVLDLSGGNATIQFSHYLRLTDANNTDQLLIEANDFVGSGWQPILSLSSDTTDSWQQVIIDSQALSAAGVALNSTVRLRFTANDADPQSIVEAGVDAVDIVQVECGPAGPLPCAADCAPDNGDGTFGNNMVNIDDLLAVINNFGQAGGPCDLAPDNGDGTFGNGIVNIDDVLEVINSFGPCP